MNDDSEKQVAASNTANVKPSFGHFIRDFVAYWHKFAYCFNNNHEYAGYKKKINKTSAEFNNIYNVFSIKPDEIVDFISHMELGYKGGPGDGVIREVIFGIKKIFEENHDYYNRMVLVAFDTNLKVIQISARDETFLVQDDWEIFANINSRDIGAIGKELNLDARVKKIEGQLLEKDDMRQALVARCDGLDGEVKTMTERLTAIDGDLSKRIRKIYDEEMPRFQGQMTAGLNKTSETLQRTLKTEAEKVTADVETRLGKATADAVDQAAAAADAKFRLMPAAQHWKEKRQHYSRLHTRYFWIFIGFIVLFIVAGIRLYGPIVNEFSLVLDLTPDALTRGMFAIVGNAFFISIPIVLAFWVARTLHRLSLLYLSYSEDAALRESMIATYINLLGEGAIDGTPEKDRVIMLNAIFRPMPGDHHVDVAPTTIADILGAGAAKKIAP